MNSFERKIRILSLTALVAAGVGLAWAQVAPAVNATAGAAGSLGSRGAATGVGAGAFGAADSAFGAASAGSDVDLAVRRQKLGVDADVDGRGTAQLGGAYGVASVGASAALDAGPTVRAIQRYSVDARKELAADIDARLDASADAMARLERESRKFKGQAQADFSVVAKEVAVRETHLKKSLKAARKASAETWPDARAAVAADYAAYAEAVARAETVAQVSRAAATQSAKPKEIVPATPSTPPAAKPSAEASGAAVAQATASASQTRNN